MKNVAPQSTVLENVQAFRKAIGETQADFWKRFGLTQPGGSRYENGQPIPKPTALLLDLFEQHIISADDLAASLKRVNASKNVIDAAPAAKAGRPASE